MVNKKRVYTTLAVAIAIIGIAGIGLGAVSGQILSEVTYYDEDFSEYNESAIQLSADDELKNSLLVNEEDWTPNYDDVCRDGNDWENQVVYGGEDTQRGSGYLEADKSKPWLQGQWYGDCNGEIGIKRQLEVPDGMSNPVLIVEHNHWHQDHTDDRDEIAIWNEDSDSGQLYTTQGWDENYGWMVSRILYNNDSLENNIQKVGTLDRKTADDNDPKNIYWKTNVFEVDPSAENITIVKTQRYASNGNDYGFVGIRQLHWVEGSSDAFGTTINGYKSIPEDDSFGGPDPYPLKVVNEPTADGEQTSLRSQSANIKKEYSFDGISEARNTYFVLEGTSNSKHPVQYTIEAFGQEVASGAINPQSTSEETVELDLETDDITVKIESKGQYDIHSVGFSTLEETSAGDPLAINNKPDEVTLNPQQGYDQSLQVLINALDITTDTLLFICMTALIVGFMVFSYTKSMRGQEFARSMLFGAAVATIVIVGLVPTMNLATWIFTGDTQRAPLADPALEAEPPTYFSTEFQAGTMDGWYYDNARATGSARPVAVGDSFDVQFTGSSDNSGVIRHDEHISLGDSLDTGFVNVDGSAEGVAGYQTNTHQVTFNVRVYVTDDGNLESDDLLDTSHGKNYVEDGYEGVEGAQELREEGKSDSIAYVGEVARSFNGEVQTSEHLATFPLDGEYIHTELIVTDNRDDENAVGYLKSVRVGATTEGSSVDHG